MIGCDRYRVICIGVILIFLGSRVIDSLILLSVITIIEQACVSVDHVEADWSPIPVYSDTYLPIFISRW
jgi:hypothetical protein